MSDIELPEGFVSKVVTRRDTFKLKGLKSNS